MAKYTHNTITKLALYSFFSWAIALAKKKKQSPLREKE